MATYQRVWWKHKDPDYPALLYSELDESRWETRKVDVYPDGRLGYADAQEEVGGTGLGECPMPPLVEINADPEFEAEEIPKEEFERLWAARKCAREMTPFPASAGKEDSNWAWLADQGVVRVPTISSKQAG